MNGAAAFLEGKYLTITYAPVPLKEVGGEVTFKDIFGVDHIPGCFGWRAHRMGVFGE
jgi:iron complex outermembrane recepter protein